MPIIKLDIKDCSECPFFKEKRCYTADSFEMAFDWFCIKVIDNKTGQPKKIAGYVEREKIEIPDWCPITEDFISLLSQVRDIIGKRVRVIKEDPMDERVNILESKRWKIGEEFKVAKIEITPYGCFLYKNTKYNLDYKRAELVT